MLPLSTASLTRLASRTSGATKNGVYLGVLSVPNLAKPKSATLSNASSALSLYKRFSGLRSLFG